MTNGNRRAAAQAVQRRPRTALLLTAALLCGAAVATPALAQDGGRSAEAGLRRFDIPAQPLAAAIAAFGRQSGLQVTAEADVTAGVQAQAVAGDYRPTDALVRLLSGTGVTWHIASGNIVVLTRAPRRSESDGAVELGPVRVEGAAGSGGYTSGAIAPTLTEGTRSYTTRAVEIGGKTARDLRDVPQSVSVVTSQRMRDQAITTTEDALRQATGVTVLEGSGFPLQRFLSRGYDMNVQYDGGATNESYFWYQTGLPDAALIDHIEVLRGSDGLFTGAGNPGGTVNIVRKRPLAEPQVLVDAQAGSWDRYRGQVDVTGPIGWDGRLRARLVGAAEDRGYFYEPGSMNKHIAYGVLEADLSSSTLLTLGGTYEKRDTTGTYGGVPRFRTGDDLGLPRDACLCADWSGRTYRSRELFARLEQSVGADWKIKASFANQRIDYVLDLGSVQGAVTPGTNAGSRFEASRTDVANRSYLAEVSVSGRFKALGLEHELTFGGNLTDLFSDGTGVGLFPTGAEPPADVFAFDPGAIARPGIPASYQPLLAFGGQVQKGAYATLRSHLTDWLQVLVGTRYGSYKYNYAAGSDVYVESGTWTPYASVIADVTSSISLYASYASIYQSQAYNLTASGKPLEPVRGQTYEIGAKGSWLDGKLTASLSAYRVREVNFGELDFQSPVQPNCCYVALTKRQRQGVDAEINGEILPGWQLSLGYSYTDVDVNQETPKHQVKLWTVAQLPGRLSDWRIGAGINAQSRTMVTGQVCDGPRDANFQCISGVFLPYAFGQKGYVVANARIDYRIDDKWSVALNVNNLFDKSYYQTLGDVDTGNFVGDPRNLLFTISGAF